MKPYGVPRNWNATEDYVKDGCGFGRKVHRRLLKIMHRRERRTTKYKLRNSAEE